MGGGTALRPKSFIFVANDLPLKKPSIFEPQAYATICARIAKLHPGSPRQWGKMTPDQMLAHLNVPLETGLGKIHPRREGNFITRPLARWYVRTASRFPPNLPTLKAFRIETPRDFEQEKQRLLDNLREAHRRGPEGPWHPHHGFGNLTPREWGEMTHLHLDHHLKQFSV